MRTSYWTYFTSAYGTIWLVVLIVATISSSYIETGWFGLIGFPIISLIYASIRRAQDNQIEQLSQDTPKLVSPKFAEFLHLHPEFTRVPEKMQHEAFHKWLNQSE